MKKMRLVIFYDWFYPGFRAGGPIQSLTNLAIALFPQYEIFVVTGSKDLNANETYEGIIINEWNNVRLPSCEGNIHVFYSTRLDRKKVSSLLKQISPSIVYLNGIFSYPFFLLPLWCIRNMTEKPRVTICPRGMLKKAALQQKAFKKKLFIFYLRHSNLLKSVYWHATTPDEALEINKYFPQNKGVFVAPNIPKTPVTEIARIQKMRGELKLVYLSLINEHKNLLLLLQLLQGITTQITLDIYGPVIDEKYWQKCQEIIHAMPERVQYKGTVKPHEVQQVLPHYHALILFTKGENFGHAIYESFSVGRPVITSHFTPWNGLYEKQAGVNIDFINQSECSQILTEFADLNQERFNSFSTGAYRLATSYSQQLNAIKEYSRLFAVT